MLKYCLTDLVVSAADSLNGSEEISQNGSEYQQRRNFSMLKGCPLLLMADGQTACFPKEAGFAGFGGDSPVHMAPLSLHIVLDPAVRGTLLHPTALRDIPVLNQSPLFKDTLRIKDLSTSFIRVC